MWPFSLIHYLNKQYILIYNYIEKIYNEAIYNEYIDHII